YGFVALTVKVDDIGLHLTERQSHLLHNIGRGLLAFAPILMKILSIVGTAALILVGGGSINHAIPFIHHFTEDSVAYVKVIPSIGNIVGAVTPTLINFAVGILAGLLVMLVISLNKKIWPKSSKA